MSNVEVKYTRTRIYTQISQSNGRRRLENAEGFQFSLNSNGVRPIGLVLKMQEITSSGLLLILHKLVKEYEQFWIKFLTKDEREREMYAERRMCPQVPRCIGLYDLELPAEQSMRLARKDRILELIVRGTHYVVVDEVDSDCETITYVPSDESEMDESEEEEKKPYLMHTATCPECSQTLRLLIGCEDQADCRACKTTSRSGKRRFSTRQRQVLIKKQLPSE